MTDFLTAIAAVSWVVFWIWIGGVIAALTIVQAVDLFSDDLGDNLLLVVWVLAWPALLAVMLWRELCDLLPHRGAR